MKKVIALVLTLAMLVSCFAFSASADTAPALVIEGASQVVAGDTYTVNIRLNDASNVVGGFQGALAYTGATVEEIVVNPQVLGYNNTEDAATVIKDDANGTIKFATVADIKGTNPTSRIWFKVTFTAQANPTFTLKDVVFSDKDATVLVGAPAETQVLAPTTPVAGDPEVSLLKVGILEQIVPNDQGIVVQAGISIPEGKAVTEYGVVFYPTSLLKGAELTVETEGAVVAAVKAGDAKFQKFIDNGMFSAVLNFNFSTDEKAAQFMGTKVTARVYYKVDGQPAVYSANSVDNGKYIQGGVSSKAVLNTVLDYADNVRENHSNIETSAYTAARDALDTTADGWYQNRKIVLEYAVDNATYKAE